MARFKAAVELAEEALRRIGEIAPHEAGADGHVLSIALRGLDNLLAETTGIERATWLVKEDVTFALPVGVQSFDIVTQSGGLILPRTFQFVVGAWLVDPANPLNTRPLELKNKRDFDNIAQNAQKGLPDFIYIDRQTPNPTLYIERILDVGVVRSIRLAYQRYQDDLSRLDGLASAEIDAAWNRWCEHRLACDLGTGPIASCPKSEVDTWRNEAAMSWSKLSAFNNRNRQSQHRVRNRYV